ncbi:Uncharacterised protein [Enterobacter hormaechei]|nr:Uncharacterised protein [Enterobacter hormaechei]
MLDLKLFKNFGQIISGIGLDDLFSNGFDWLSDVIIQPSQQIIYFITAACFGCLRGWFIK